MKSHVYQLALRRADNEKKQFIIESDLIYSEEKISQTQLLAISEKHQCDVKATYLGIITAPKKEEIIDVEYHSKEMIEETLLNWKQLQEETEQLNG